MGATNTSADSYCYLSSGSGVAYCDDYSLSVQKAMSQSTNLISNPDFESGTAAPWNAYNKAQVVRSNAHSGTYALQVQPHSSGANQTFTGLLPQATYMVCGWAKVTHTGDTVSVAGVKNYGGPEGASGITSTTYQQGCTVFTMGATNTSADIYCYMSSGSGVAYCDDYSLVLF
jgi:hypothetical protein